MNDKWDERYSRLAQDVSSWSKDPSAKIGSVAVGSKGQVLSQGYNGFPRNIKDTDDRLTNRDIKYKYVVHAEMNMIYNATYNGVSLDGATVYVSGLPVCSECAKGLIQVGVKNVVMSNIDIESSQKWLESFELTKQLFKEANITWRIIND